MAVRVPISRRKFLKGSAAVTTGTALFSAASYAAITGANARIHVALVGLGERGGHHLDGVRKVQDACNVRIVQVCDLKTQRAASAAHKAGHLAAATPRYEEVLVNPSVDAVVIATPDGCHSDMAMAAIRANKHVYLEPPLGLTAQQAWEVFRFAQESSRVRVQVGAPSTSFELYDRLAAYLKDPGVGRLVQVHSSYNDNVRGAVFDRLTALLKVTDLGYPSRVVAGGGMWQPGERRPARQSAPEGATPGQVPDRYNAILEYPGGTTLTLVGNPANPVRTCVAIRGEKATIRVDEPQSPTRAEIRARGDSALRVKPVALTASLVCRSAMYQNFFDACRDSSVALHAPLELAIRTNVALCLIAKAYRDQMVCSWTSAEKMGVATA